MDDRFLRQLLDSPRDDAPRRVYADWLEDHNDPRAAYLRAELAWASKRRGRKRLEAAARKLAAALDPVWVARVSRPPLGVCCDHVRFRKGGPERTAADLDAVEQRLKARLPADYRAFLLNYNGGVPDPSHVPDPRSHGRGLKCLQISGFNRSTGGRGENDIEHELQFMHSIHRIGGDRAGPYPYEGLLPIAPTTYDLGMLLIGIAPENFGRITHLTEWARSMGEASARSEFGPSFADLLSKLGPDLDD